MSQYTATQPGLWEGHTTISKGAFKGVTGSAFRLYIPISLTGASVVKDSSDGNKMWVEPYTDTTSVKQSLGVGWYNKAAKATDTDVILGAGQGWRRRGISILHEGIQEVVFVSAAIKTETEFGMRLAPHPSGAVEWQTGMSMLGWALEPGIGTGQHFSARIFAYQPELNYY